MNTPAAVEERLTWLRKITDKPDTCTEIVPEGTKRQGWVLADLDFLLGEVKRLKTLIRLVHKQNYSLQCKLEGRLET